MLPSVSPTTAGRQAPTTEVTDALDDRTPWPASARQPLVLAVIALGACAGYYLGAYVGLQLRIANATTSVLWPPNAVLT